MPVECPTYGSVSGRAWPVVCELSEVCEVCEVCAYLCRLVQGGRQGGGELGPLDDVVSRLALGRKDS